MAISKIEDILDKNIYWKRVSGKVEWSATVEGEPCKLTMNNFPDEPLYTISWRGQTLDLDDAPANWSLHKKSGPQTPKP